MTPVLIARGPDSSPQPAAEVQQPQCAAAAKKHGSLWLQLHHSMVDARHSGEANKIASLFHLQAWLQCSVKRSLPPSATHLQRLDGI